MYTPINILILTVYTINVYVYIYTLGPTVDAYGQRWPLRTGESGPHEGTYTTLRKYTIVYLGILCMHTHLYIV